MCAMTEGLSESHEISLFFLTDRKFSESKTSSTPFRLSKSLTKRLLIFLHLIFYQVPEL